MTLGNKKGVSIIVIIFFAVVGFFLLTQFNLKDQQNNAENKDENESEIAKNGSLVVENPKINQVINSPLELRGEVRGTWLFEGTSEVVLTDWDGRIIAETYIEAQENWMNENFVPFKATLEFQKPEDIGAFSDSGSIIFQKANPSGLPEKDDALEFSIRFR